MLLEEDYVPERLNERLVTDLDAGVALAASERLEHAGGVFTPVLDPTAELEPATQPLSAAPTPVPTAELEPVRRATASADDGTEPPADDWSLFAGAEPESAVGVPTARASRDDADDDWGDEQW